MRSRVQPLLCELHAHTTWSDGELTVRELIDLHGSLGFDVLCVTDHVVRSDDPWVPRDPGCVHVSNFDSYLAEVEREAARAQALYGLVVIPGLELTYNDLDPSFAAHAVAVGLRRFVGVEDGIEHAMREAGARGAAILAAHPDSARDRRATARTRWFGRTWRELAGLVHRYELFCQAEVFAWVAEAELPTVASGDVHFADHVTGWKTLVPCAKKEAAVVEYLRSRRPVFLTRLEAAAAELAA